MPGMPNGRPWPASNQPIATARRFRAPLQAFIQAEAAAGILLLGAALAALAWANSPWDGAYRDLWHARLSLETGLFSLREDLRGLVNDGLMAIFFFVVGLEIKRELLFGELASRRRAALPVAAALGGMAVPALIYTAWNAGGDGARGWAIPMATDIAFALGVLALLGRRVPFALKVFVLALAVVDDLGAIAIIAFFYTEELSLKASLTALGLLAVVLGLRRAGLRNVDVYVIVGGLFWLAVLKSGVHATVAGVVLAFLTPARADSDVATFENEAQAMVDRLRRTEASEEEKEQTILNDFEDALRRSSSPLERIERRLHPWTVFAILPVFAFANAGLDLGGGAIGDAAGSTVTAGVALGLLAGKPLGILLFSWIAVRSGLAALPRGVGWRHLAGAGLVAGIGFTVSLFVTGLAFTDTALQAEAKAGVFVASLVAGFAGYIVLRWRTAAAPPA